MIADLVSVIVPVYNVEDYIGKCIESVVQQTYKNLELILVDDGSTDKSGQICEEYAQKDDRIVVLHRQNGGVSRARNIALDEMRGKYCIFVDGDDWIDKSFVERLYGQVKESRTDIVFANHLFVGEDSSRYLYPYHVCEEFNREQAVISFLLYSHAVIGKLYRSELYRHVRFPEGVKIAEDGQALIEVLTKVDRVRFCSETVYYRLVRDESASRKQDCQPSIDALKVYEKIAQYVQTNFPDLLPYIECYMTRQYAAVLLKPGVSAKKPQYREIKRRYRFWRKKRGWSDLETRGMNIRYLVLSISPGMYHLLKKILLR